MAARPPAPRTSTFIPERDTDYQFAVTTTNALLQPLVKDLFLKTNHLEGRLSGTLVDHERQHRRPPHLERLRRPQLCATA